VKISDVLHWKPAAQGRLGSAKKTPGSTTAASAEVVTPRPGHDATAAPQVQARPRPTLAVDRTVWVSVLIENSVTGRNLKAEHGLSYHLRCGRHALLFDTGQSELLQHNAQEMGLGLQEVEAIALSHGHYDHAGGVRLAHALAPSARLFLHPASLEPRFAGNPDGSSRAVGFTEESRQAIQHAGDRVVWTTQPTEVLDGVFLTGEIPRATDFEDTGGAFFLDEECTRRDPLADDQAMFFDTVDGLVVLLGCAHAGVVNTLHYVRGLTRGRPIHTVVGGMHLLEASAQRIEKTLACFRQLAIRQLGPAHCTGVMPSARLRVEFPDRCVGCTVGSSLAFRR
jgi:7,8-dihydropterin-6-yl-methyl-4-(beta-D-ribofuranosyl)aminobenzene 5'-phosphate synthase